MPDAGRSLVIFHCQRCKATRSEIPIVPEQDPPFGIAEGGVLFRGRNELLDRLLFCTDQQHHGAPQFIPHTRDLQHFLRRLYLFHHLKGKAAV